jgi:DNA-binding transcriptional LysR family regulator
VVTRAIQTLENQLGELLFHRNTRQCRVTREGERLAQLARQGWRGGLHVPARRSSTAQQVEGTVRLTAPEAIGQASLVHSLARLRQHYPDLHFELHLEDDETNVVDEQIDIGIRHGLIRDSRFVARQVAEVHFFMVAAPGLLAQCGVPQTLEALQQQPVVGTIDQRTGKPWPWFFRHASQWTPRDLAFSSNSTQAECAAVLAGLGFAQLPGFIAIPHLQSGALIEVLSAQAPTPWALSVYRPQRSPVPARIRVVYDWLVNDFSNRQFFPAMP